MKKFLLHLVCFVLFITVVLCIITYGVDRGLTRTKRGRMQVWNEISQDSINADILILGNSHARVQIDPRIISGVFNNARTYNLGLEGYSFDMQAARYHLYCSHNRAPKLIVQCVDLFIFDKSTWTIDRVQFLPFLYDTAINNTLVSLGMPAWTQYLPFLKYRGEANAVLGALRGVPALPKDDTSTVLNGYRPVTHKWDEEDFQIGINRRQRHTIQVNPALWASFRKFVEDCNREHIELCLVFTPHHTRFLDQVGSFPYYIRKLQTEVGNKARVLDFSQLPMAKDTTLFLNATHLNTKGATIFSTILADTLCRLYNVAGSGI